MKPRVLILGLAPVAWLEQLADTASQLVILLPASSADAVAQLRRQFRDCDHVMAATADPPVIPWMDQFFDAVWAAADWPAAELRRVATPDAHFEPLPASDQP